MQGVTRVKGTVSIIFSLASEETEGTTLRPEVRVHYDQSNTGKTVIMMNRADVAMALPRFDLQQAALPVEHQHRDSPYIIMQEPLPEYIIGQIAIILVQSALWYPIIAFFQSD